MKLQSVENMDGHIFCRLLEFVDFVELRRRLLTEIRAVILAPLDLSFEELVGDRLGRIPHGQREHARGQRRHFLRVRAKMLNEIINISITADKGD